MSVSFYDFDYIIEINQRRLEEYIALANRATDRIAPIVLVYSALGIFLIPLINHLLKADIANILFDVASCLLLILMLLSIFYFIRLLLPVTVMHLDPPAEYYDNLMSKYEKMYILDTVDIDLILKNAFVDELEKEILKSKAIFERKGAYFKIALQFAILALIPYCVCVIFQLLNNY